MSAATKRTAVVESTATWRRTDRIGLALCWTVGIALCVICAAIIVFLAIKGLSELSPSLVFSRPEGGLDQSRSGGILDPIIGTVMLVVLGTIIAIPVAVATALWLTEYGRPFWLARMVESCVEVIAGTPTVVFAIFGLIVFQESLFAILSFEAEGGAVVGRSFLTASAAMALIALPLIVASTREGLLGIPGHVREASYGLGKTKWATIRRVLLPAVRRNVATGTALGMGRIAGDTAIVVILLGATLQITQTDSPAPGPLDDLLRGSGSSLTSFVFVNSPAGEGNAPDKAYAAAFVLLLIVIALNWVVGKLGGSREAQWRA